MLIHVTLEADLFWLTVPIMRAVHTPLSSSPSALSYLMLFFALYL